MWVSYKAWELRRCLILKVYQKWAWLDSDHSKLPWITAGLKMSWCNFLLQNSDYKSHIYKDPWHPACRKNTSTAIRLIIPRNPFISHPSTNSFPSRNKIMHSPLEKMHKYISYRQEKWGGRGSTKHHRSEEHGSMAHKNKTTDRRDSKKVYS